MCVAIPGEIVELVPDHRLLARVDVEGIRRTVNIGLVADEQLQPGDWILIHAGLALSKIDAAEARAALDFLAALGQADDGAFPVFEGVRIDRHMVCPDDVAAEPA